jgi:hypothetical protein
MKVRVEVRGVELEIPCGDGDQVSSVSSNLEKICKISALCVRSLLVRLCCTASPAMSSIYMI